jgi:hypothetical protein
MPTAGRRCACCSTPGRWRSIAFACACAVAGVCGAIWLATGSLAALALGALPCLFGLLLLLLRWEWDFVLLPFILRAPAPGEPGGAPTVRRLHRRLATAALAVHWLGAVVLAALSRLLLPADGAEYEEALTFLSP